MPEATITPPEVAAVGAERARLATRLATDPILTAPISARAIAVVPLLHEFKTLAAKRRWLDLDERAIDVQRVAHRVVVAALSDLTAADAAGRDVVRLGELLPGVNLSPYADYLELVVDHAARLHDAHSALALDALRARLLVLTHDARGGHPPLPEDDARRALSDHQAQLRRRWQELHEQLVRADREGLRAALTSDQESVPRLADDLGRLASHLYGAAAAPYAATTAGRPRRWAAQVAMEASTTLRWCWTTLAIEALLSRRMIADLERLAHEAETLSLDPAPSAAQAIALDDLVEHADRHHDRLVVVEGLVTALAFTVSGGKRNTLITIAPLGQEEEPKVRVRSHFVNLATRGVAATSYVRLTGRFDRAAGWADGQPGIDLKRASLAESSSWTDRMVHAASPCFAQLPGGMLIEWSIVPGEPAVLDFLSTRELRYFRDVATEED